MIEVTQNYGSENDLIVIFCPFLPILFSFKIFSEKIYLIIVGDIVSRKCNFYSALGLFSLVLSFCLLFIK